MSKSKMPTLNEVGSAAKKLFTDLKTSVNEIVDDYKEAHAEEQEAKDAEAEDKPETETDAERKDSEE